jgi:hypothetical protein
MNDLPSYFEVSKPFQRFLGKALDVQVDWHVTVSVFRYYATSEYCCSVGKNIRIAVFWNMIPCRLVQRCTKVRRNLLHSFRNLKRKSIFIRNFDTCLSHYRVFHSRGHTLKIQSVLKLYEKFHFRHNKCNLCSLFLARVSADYVS